MGAGLTHHDDVLELAGEGRTGVRLSPPPPAGLLESDRPVDDPGPHSYGRSRGEEGRVLVHTFRAGGVQAVLRVAACTITSFRSVTVMISYSPPTSPNPELPAKAES